MASGLLRRRMKGLGDHQIFIAAYVGLARTSQVEHQFDVHVGLRLGKVAGHQSPDIFRQRYTQFTGSLASSPMSVTFQRNLGTSHHDGTIIAQPQGSFLRGLGFLGDKSKGRPEIRGPSVDSICQLHQQKRNKGGECETAQHCERQPMDCHVPAVSRTSATIDPRPPHTTPAVSCFIFSA
jgi:hypothetical protein